MKSSLTVQNVMRRIIENYFKLLGKLGDDELILKFPTKEEQEMPEQHILSTCDKEQP